MAPSNLSELSDTDTPRRSLRRLGQVAATGAATALLIGLAPGTASAAGQGPPVGVQSARSAPAAAAPAPTSATQVAMNTAMAQVGKGYAWGASGPGVFDCSGLTQAAFRSAGINLPHSSRMQSRLGTPVSRANLMPGDLVFYYSPVGHVGIYIGNGQMVNALNSRTGVIVSSVNMWGYVGARRIA